MEFYMKKLLILSVIAFSSVAFAEDVPQPPMGAPNAGEHRHCGMMANLTDEQKSCIEAFGCKMPERTNKDDKGPKTPFGDKPEAPVPPQPAE